MTVNVDKSKCTGCGICADICPEGAIHVNDVAVIDEAVCNGCGACVAECPNQALAPVGRQQVSAQSSLPAVSPQILSKRDETIRRSPRTLDGQVGFRQIRFSNLLGNILDIFTSFGSRNSGQGMGGAGQGMARGGRGRMGQGRGRNRQGGGGRGRRRSIR